MLAAAALYNESQLRADLQHHYGIDLDDAMAGAHTVRHIAALVACLPHDCCINRARNEDSAWTLTEILLATIINMFSAEGSPRVGPSWMTHVNMLDARVMTVDELNAELSKPRRCSEDG